MRKALFTFSLAFLSFQFLGQYSPMVVESHTWKIINYGLVVMPYLETIAGDTIIDDVTYKMHWTQSEGYPAYVNGMLREDTENQRVYGTYGSGEYLLYDFTLEVGEEAEVYGLGIMHTIVVSELGTVMVAGEARKKITFTEVQGLGGYWIEGIGSVHGIMDAALGYVLDFLPVVTCFYQGNDLAWSNPESTDIDCALFLTTEEYEMQYAAIFPNPAQDVVRFGFPTSSNNQVYQVALFDSAGRRAITQTSVQNQIDLQGISPGLYMIQIFEGDILRAIARVSVQ
jgi:hypothetical protein